MEKRYVANKVPDSEYAGGGSREADPILSLRGLGKAMWASEEADAYVERLREGWGRAGSSGTRTPAAAGSRGKLPAGRRTTEQGDGVSRASADR